MTRGGSYNPMRLFDGLHKLRADYSAARPSRYRRTRSGLGGPADAHLRQADYDRIREDSRAIDRDVWVVGQGFDRATDSIVHNGFDFEPDTGDEGLNTAQRDEFQEWSGNPLACDMAGDNSFADLEWLAWRHVLADGDTFALPLDSGHLQLIEGDVCQSPRSVEMRNQSLHLGVLVDDFYKPKEYWFIKRRKRTSHAQVLGDVDKVPAFNSNGHRNVFHVLSRKRITQTRALPALKAVQDIIGMADDVMFSALVKQQISSIFGVFLTRDGDGPAHQFKLGQQTTRTNDDGSDFVEEDLKSGLIVRLPRGVTPHEYSPKFPNPEWMAHMRLLLRIFGLQINLPLFMVLMDSSDTVFHGYRGELDLHRRQAEADQQLFAERFHRPVWEWKQRQFAAKDAARRKKMADLGRRFFKVKIKPPRWGYIEPVKDVLADQARINGLMISPSGRASERGQDYGQIIRETIRDNTLAITSAIQAAGDIEKKHPGSRVKWQEVLRLTAGESEVSKALVQADQPDQPEQDNKPRRKEAKRA